MSRSAVWSEFNSVEYSRNFNLGPHLGTYLTWGIQIMNAHTIAFAEFDRVPLIFSLLYFGVVLLAFGYQRVTYQSSMSVLIFFIA
jgi:hypothetical protein